MTVISIIDQDGSGGVISVIYNRFWGVTKVTVTVFLAFFAKENR